MTLVLMIIVGAAAGFIATRLMKLETDIPTTIAIGIGGALVGGILIRFFLEVASWLGGFVGAVIGAVLLIWIWRSWFARR